MKTLTLKIFVRGVLLLAAACVCAASAKAQTVTPGNNGLVFTSAQVGIAAGSAETLSATFQVSGYAQAVTPTAAMHYGLSYAAGAVTCTGSAGNQSCTVPVTFTPKYPGARPDAVVLSISGTPVATTLVYGVGQSPFALLDQGVITSPVPNYSSYLYQSVVGEDGTVYVIAGGGYLVEVSPAGVVTSIPISGLNSGYSVGIDGAGTIYLASGGIGTTLTTISSTGVQGTLNAYVPTNAPSCSNNNYLDAVVPGIAGDLYVLNGGCQWVADYKRDGTSSATVINPSMIQPSTLAVDSNEDVFVSGYDINEITAGGTQTQISTNGATSGLAVDAADTLYGSLDTGVTAVAMLPASNYTQVEDTLDHLGPPSVGPDGSVYIASLGILDKVDRLQTAPLAFGSSSGPLTFRIYNGGNETLTISSFTVSGEGFSQSSGVTNACGTGTTVAAGALCNVSIAFDGTHSGAYTGSVTFTTNTLNTTATTQSVALTAAINGIYVVPSTTSLGFGNQTEGTTSSAQTITLTNNGLNADAGVGTPSTVAGFTVSQGTCTSNIAPGASCNLSVTFSPAAAQAYGGTVNVPIGSDASTQTQTVSFTVSGTGTAAIVPPTLTPSSLTFAPAAVGSGDDPQSVTLTNPNSTALTGIAITFTGPDASDFSTYPTGTCDTTLAANSSCTIAVRFYPMGTGTRTATLNVAQSDTAQPLTTSLTGIGLVAPTAEIQFYPAQLNYVAGNGMHPPQCNDTGDDGPATSAELCQPYGAAMDAAGNTYVIDYGDNVVKKIDTSGVITTFAGVESLQGGFGGDGGPAIGATLNAPVGIAFDPSGNAYISDSGNGRIREVNASTGIITTFVGGGAGTYFNPGTSGTNVALLQPGGLAFDPSGNLYIAVDGQQIVAEVTPAGVATVYAGVLTQSGPGKAGYNGDNIAATAAELNAPQQVASDRYGNIYIADSLNYRIRAVNATTGIITTVAGNGTQGDTGDGGPATSAEIGAQGVAVDLAGDVYEADNVLGSIRKVNVSTGDILTVAGGGTGAVGGAANLAGISTNLPAIDNYGNVLIPDGESGQAALLSEGAIGYLQFGSEQVNSTTAPLTVTMFNVGDAELDFTTGTFTATGDFAVTGGTCESTEGPGAAGCTLTVTFTPTAAGIRTGSISVASNSVGGGTNTILLNGTGTPAVTPTATLTPSTVAFGNQTVNTTSAEQTLTLSNTSSVALTGIGISLTGTNTADFATTTTCGTTLAAMSSCTISVMFTPASAASFSATVSVADNAGSSPQTSALTGTGMANTAPAPVAQLQFTPGQLSTVIAGNSIGNCRASNQVLCEPSTTVQDTNGNLFILDSADSVVRKLDTSGNLTIYAGTVQIGGSLSSGDGGPATAAYISSPEDIALDNANNLYIAEYGNNRVREVNATTGIISTFAGGGNTPYLFEGGTVPANSVSVIATSVATDVFGDVFIGDNNHSYVLKVDTSGNLSLFAGSIVASGGGLSANPGYSGDGGPANTAQLQNPTTIATDPAGDVFIADKGNNVIRKVTAATGDISTVAGNQALGGGNTGDGGIATSAEIYASAVAVDLAGDLFISSAQSVRKVDMHGDISTVATVPAGNPYFFGYLRIDLAGDVLLPTNAALYSLGPQGMLAFGNQNVGTTSAAMTLTLENTGDAALTLGSPLETVTGNFAVSGGTCTTGQSVASGATCTLLVTFTPQTAGSLSGALSFATNGIGTPQVVNLTGTGVPAVTPTATLTPSTVPFGNQTVNTTSMAQTLTLSNTGSSDLTGITISLGGTNPADFAYTTTCETTLAATSSCTISVTFTPASAASFSATISVADNAGSSPQTSTLTGTGTVAAAPVASLTPTTIAFGNQTVNTTSTSQTLTLTNTGNATLTGITISLTGANPGDFADSTTCGATLAASASCTISVTFTPASVASFSATVSVADSASGSPQTASLTGTGTAVPAPIATLSPATLNFPTTTVGSTSASQTLTLSNSGNAALAISSVSIGGTNPTEFADTSACGSSLAAGSSCSITVTFTPDSAASFTATLSVADNASNSPQTATLNGTGQGVAADFGIAATPATLSVPAGAVAQFAINLTGVNGDFNQPVALSVTGVPNGSTASFSPATVTPGSGATSVLSIATPSLTGELRMPPGHSNNRLPLLALLLLPLLGLRKARKQMPPAARLLTLGLLALAALIPLSGCGGGYFGDKAQTVTLTITGTSGAIQHSTTVTLTIQ